MVILMLTECAIIEIERGIISNNRDYSGPNGGTYWNKELYYENHYDNNVLQINEG